jgi:hypothetical protein
MELKVLYTFEDEGTKRKDNMTDLLINEGITNFDWKLAPCCEKLNIRHYIFYLLGLKGPIFGKDSFLENHFIKRYPMRVLMSFINYYYEVVALILFTALDAFSCLKRSNIIVKDAG